MKIVYSGNIYKTITVNKFCFLYQRVVLFVYNSIFNELKWSKILMSWNDLIYSVTKLRTCKKKYRQGFMKDYLP